MIRFPLRRGENAMHRKCFRNSEMYSASRYWEPTQLAASTWITSFNRRWTSTTQKTLYINTAALAFFSNMLDSSTSDFNFWVKRCQQAPFGSAHHYFCFSYKRSLLQLFLFCVWTIFEVLNLLQDCFCFSIFGPEACQILVPWPGMEPAPPALEGDILITGLPGKSSLLWVFMYWTCGTLLVVYWLDSALPLQGARGPSLVRKRRFNMLCSGAKNQNKQILNM